jgi:hypothetical protein
VLVLGPWGCGWRGLGAEPMAGFFADVLNEYPGLFKVCMLSTRLVQASGGP